MAVSAVLDRALLEGVPPGSTRRQTVVTYNLRPVTEETSKRQAPPAEPGEDADWTAMPVPVIAAPTTRSASSTPGADVYNARRMGRRRVTTGVFDRRKRRDSAFRRRPSLLLLLLCHSKRGGYQTRCSRRRRMCGCAITSP